MCATSEGCGGGEAGEEHGAAAEAADAEAVGTDERRDEAQAVGEAASARVVVGALPLEAPAHNDDAHATMPAEEAVCAAAEPAACAQAAAEDARVHTTKTGSAAGGKVDRAGRVKFGCANIVSSVFRGARVQLLCFGFALAL